VKRPLTVKYMDMLQRRFPNEVGFYPLDTLQEALEIGRVVWAEDNNEPCGYLWFGPIRGGHDIVMYQAIIDYDSQRHHLGHGMVREMLDMGRAKGATGARARVASNSDSNAFWQAIGFYCTRVTEGGRKRRRKINHYRTDLTASLWSPEEFIVEADDTPIDLTQYNKDKAAGVAMPSRFSRTHYP
jgi:ribosomal protein S18 acetylase RimI-like enzyme